MHLKISTCKFEPKSEYKYPIYKSQTLHAGSSDKARKVESFQNFQGD